MNDDGGPRADLVYDDDERKMQAQMNESLSWEA
jgi:hypothetical protein